MIFCLKLMMDETRRVEVSQIVDEVKSQGLFDKLRRDCLSDVETLAAYQRLKDQVDRHCTKFLTDQRWHPNLNKTVLRDRLRDQLLKADFVNSGVRTLVDRLVTSEKVRKDVHPPIERIVYNCLGLPYPSESQKSIKSEPKMIDDEKMIDLPISISDRSKNRRSESSDDFKNESIVDEETKLKRCRTQKDENEETTSKELTTNGETTTETPVQDELCSIPIPVVDPSPPKEESKLDNSDELSVHWHVTQLSPNPENEDDKEKDQESVVIDKDLRAIVFDSVEVESPAHEGL